MRNVFTAAFFSLAMIVHAAAAQASDNPWVAMTVGDLQGIHDVLLNNHPGPVDPNNPRYRRWLEDGLVQANQRAANATSFADYVRALEFYTNGFQDDHIGAGPNVSVQNERWPQFLVKGTSENDVHVVYAEPGAGVPVGATLVSCDGKKLSVLMAERIEPYFWNSAIPHQRYDHVEELFHLDANDSMERLHVCQFSSGAVTLAWKRIGEEDLQKTLDRGLAEPERPLRIQFLNGVWLISIPTLAYPHDTDVATIRAFIADLAQRAPKLRGQTVVFDVRGDTGGDSAWGEEIVKAYWGEPLLRYVASQFDTTTDWRASQANLEMVEYNLKRDQAAGLADSAADLTRIRDAMQVALKSGQDFAHTGEPPKPWNGPPPPNPVTGKVYFLTDTMCRSACLDFADIILRLPGVTHIGLPTAADAIYIDNTVQTLPSKLGWIGYSMKVLRNRARKNNEWYEPKIRWPGGDMTDDEVTKWVSSLR